MLYCFFAEGCCVTRIIDARRWQHLNSMLIKKCANIIALLLQIVGCFRKKHPPAESAGSEAAAAAAPADDRRRPSSAAAALA